MAKAKKKLSKLNSAIRRIFDNLGFDDGIELVETSTLIELTHVLGVIPDSMQREELIRLFRRLWSEADPGVRHIIVDFFKAQKKMYKSSHTKEAAIEKSEKIAMLLEEMDVTQEEAKELFDAFIDVRTRKINRSKLEHKLSHLRFDKKKKQLERILEGKFDITDRFEFHHAFTYALFGETFKKIITVHSGSFSYAYLSETDTDTIIQELMQIKTDLIDAKQHQIDHFLQTLQNGHAHLSSVQILSALRSSPPDQAITRPPLSNALLKEVLNGERITVDELQQSDDAIILDVDAEFLAPYLQNPLHYRVNVMLDKEKTLQAIWEGKELSMDTRLEETKKESEKRFLYELGHLIGECSQQAKLLGLDEAALYGMIYEYLLPLPEHNLQISAKMSRKILFHFNQNIQTALLKRQKQELLGRTIRDFKNLFPLAREMHRRLLFHTGPTNSGKTYAAMQTLRKADTGYYLAPLRLLALEGYEQLREYGLNTSLITGEEQQLDENATHISSTIEMLNFEVDVDVCVIDEVQMIDDRDRGWAWANAIIGAPAKTVIMTGSSNAKKAITELADYLNEPLEIIEFKRKNPLELMHRATPISEIRSGSAVIAFSRKEVLRLKQQLSRYFKVSVVYGNLSPEVRREEARRFRSGETEILVATDAIAMGLNLPIQTILFAKGDKYDGETQRPLTPSEIHQISGRAGRFGLSEKGFVGALKPDVLQLLHKQFPKPAKAISLPFNVSANLEHIKLVSSILEERSLSEVLHFFVKNMHFDGPFRAANLEGMAEAAEIVDRYELDLPSKYHLACAPLTLSSPYIISAFERYVHALEQHKPVAYIPPSDLDEYAETMEQLLEAEDRVKEISLYLWLSYRFSDYFIDAEKARRNRVVLNRFIEASLNQSHFIPRCRQCTKPLPVNSPYAICQSCFRKLNVQKRRSGGNRAIRKR